MNTFKESIARSLLRESVSPGGRTEGFYPRGHPKAGQRIKDVAGFWLQQVTQSAAADEKPKRRKKKEHPGQLKFSGMEATQRRHDKVVRLLKEMDEARAGTPREHQRQRSHPGPNATPKQLRQWTNWLERKEAAQRGTDVDPSTETFERGTGNISRAAADRSRAQRTAQQDK
jgi:hypothetical protein